MWPNSPDTEDSTANPTEMRPYPLAKVVLRLDVLDGTSQGNGAYARRAACRLLTMVEKEEKNEEDKYNLNIEIYKVGEMFAQDGLFHEQEMVARYGLFLLDHALPTRCFGVFIGRQLCDEFIDALVSQKKFSEAAAQTSDWLKAVADDVGVESAGYVIAVARAATILLQAGSRALRTVFASPARLNGLPLCGSCRSFRAEESPVVMIAQATHANLLASATVTSRAGRRCRSRLVQAANGSGPVCGATASSPSLRGRGGVLNRDCPAWSPQLLANAAAMSATHFTMKSRSATASSRSDTDAPAPVTSADRPRDPSAIGVHDGGTKRPRRRHRCSARLVLGKAGRGAGVGATRRPFPFDRNNPPLVVFVCWRRNPCAPAQARLLPFKSTGGFFYYVA